MARGGLSKLRVNFKGCKESMEKVFGPKSIPVTQMTKSLWGYVKKRKLMKK